MKNQWDTIYATYWWDIHLDHRHPENYNPNVATLSGYSKMQGHDEAKDKVQMLMRKLVMLARNGYLKRSTHIDVYMRNGRIIDKKTGWKLFTLFPNQYVIPGNQLSSETWFREITAFLQKYYDHLRSGKDVKYLLPPQRPAFSKDEYLDVTKQNFKTQMHLYAYAEKLIRNGHNFAQVQAFVHKYAEQKPFSAQPK